MINFLVKSPIYPHWLEYLKMDQGNNRILKNIKGNVLEVGAGDGSRKKELLKKYKGIEKYIATDCSAWDKEFEKCNSISEKYGKIGEIFFGYKKRIKLDKICSATKLPFENESFDYHLSFEVLEHINDPIKYFSEASRVLKKGGYIIFCVPFLYRMHGGEPDHKMDYFRYTNGFFYKIAQDENLKVIDIHSNTGFGTTFSSMANQWLIRRINESSVLFRIIFFVISPAFFLISGILGYLLDVKLDKRFATRFHVIMQKI